MIAAIFIILVLAFVGVIFVSLIGSSSLTAVNDLQSCQALAVAEGGTEYTRAYLAPYVTWYDFATDPVVVANNLTLGSGTFTVSISFPATSARKGFVAAASVIRVFSVDRFSAGGSIAVGGPGDIRTYTGTATGGGLGPRFTGVSTGAAAYPAGTPIYPVLTLAAGITATDATLLFSGTNAKFLSKGTIFIDDPVNGDEELACAGTQAAPAAFTGCMRGANGTTAVAHAAGLNILPIQSAEEALITASGIVGNARRDIADAANQ